MLKKRCQIYASLPITCFEVPIVGDTELNLTENEIYKCLCTKAEVIEILPDGRRINLDFKNYNKNNYIVEAPIVEEKPEPATPIKVELAPETTTEPVEKVEEKPVESIEEKVEEEVESVEEDTEIVEEELVEVKEETPVVAETVKNYQTNSRNNNYNKKSKNKK